MRLQGNLQDSFPYFCVQNYLWFCFLLDAGLRLGQWEPRLLKNEVANFRSEGILNHLVKGDAFDTIYLTRSSPKPLQKTNKHKMREVLSWMIRKKQWWNKLELPVESCRDLCCICVVQYVSYMIWIKGRIVLKKSFVYDTKLFRAIEACMNK